jgi:hypothetical protein
LLPKQLARGLQRQAANPPPLLRALQFLLLLLLQLMVVVLLTRLDQKLQLVAVLLDPALALAPTKVTTVPPTLKPPPLQLSPLPPSPPRRVRPPTPQARVQPPPPQPLHGRMSTHAPRVSMLQPRSKHAWVRSSRHRARRGGPPRTG